MVNCTIDFKDILLAIVIQVDILSRIQDHENKNADCFMEVIYWNWAFWYKRAKYWIFLR